MTESIINKLSVVTFEELSDFVDQRQLLIDQLKLLMESDEVLTSSNKDRIQNITKQDTCISNRMMELKIEAQDWLQQRNQAKVQRSAYEAGYSQDSILMDRKK
ncbi:hypothetical protein [Paenibacillus glacialis]|nr:hypothetical protein [Paenibacillus glacialis]